jgi:hypothetical protein
MPSTASEGARFQVRRSAFFIFVIPRGFSPEESAVSLNCATLQQPFQPALAGLSQTSPG